MADNVPVTPSGHPDSVQVKTDEINSVHWPVYKLAYGEDGSATLVDGDAGIPMSLDSSAKVRQDEILDELRQINRQLKVMNYHLQTMTDERVNEDDL